MFIKDYAFIGCSSDFKEASIVVFGAPYDGTTTYRPGARFAPQKIRSESNAGIETFSPYQNKDLEDIKVHDAGDLDLPFGNCERALSMIEQAAGRILEAGKFPVMLGGEHLITFGAFRAIIKKHPDAAIIHFDAHTDLRDDYIGEKLSHSTVIRRCFDLMKKDAKGRAAVYQFGIRSGRGEEFGFAAKYTNLTKNNFDNLDAAIKSIGSRPVYFTIDLDVLDPSEFPGTGTPEAGGVRFLQLLEATIKVFSKLNVVGCDINELSPPNDPSGVSAALACKFLREVLLAKR